MTHYGPYGIETLHPRFGLIRRMGRRLCLSLHSCLTLRSLNNQLAVENKPLASNYERIRGWQKRLMK